MRHQLNWSGYGEAGGEGKGGGGRAYSAQRLTITASLALLEQLCLPLDILHQFSSWEAVQLKEHVEYFRL